MLPTATVPRKMSFVFVFALIFITLRGVEPSHASIVPNSEKIDAPIDCPHEPSRFVYRKECDPCLYLRELDLPVHVRAVIPCRNGLPECSKCSSPTQCSSGHCLGGKCVYNSPTSMERCFPGKKGECDSCSTYSECLTEMCSGPAGEDPKCVFDNPSSFEKCFLKKRECSLCSAPIQCVTHKCFNGKCVYDTATSMAKCFPTTTPPRKKGECTRCSNDTECITNNCVLGKCIYDDPSSTQNCFPTPTLPPAESQSPCNRRRFSKYSIRKNAPIEC